MKKIILACLALLAFTAYSQVGSRAAVDSLLKVKDSIELNKKLVLLEQGSETDQETLVQYYSAKRNNVKRDAVMNDAAQRFPNGMLAFRKSQKDIRDEKDETKRNSLYAEAKKKFSNQDFTQLNLALATDYIEKKELNKALSYLEEVRNPSFIPMMARKLAALDSAAAIQLVKKKVEAGNNDTALAQAFLNLEGMYGGMLLKEGKYDAAFPYVEKLYLNSRMRDKSTVRAYTFLLEKKNRYKEIIPILENSVVKGEADEESKERLKLAYIRGNKAANATELVAALEARYREHVKEEVTKLLVNKPAPAFVLKDAAGNQVSLADFRNKIIVVDFWATWCGPCKNSFPAMKTALSRYKDDPNVKFLFVHTWEQPNASPLQEASNYLKENNYPFDLLMDYKDPESKKNPVVTSFEVTGIPTKFIIDGKGNIRFSVRGFSGNDNAVVEELSAMIEMLKKG